MGKLTLLLCLVLLLGSVAGQPVPPGTVGDLVNPVLDPVVQTVTPRVGNETGEDLVTEDISIDLFVDMTNVDYDLVGITFGGGKVGTDVDARVHFEFRAIGTGRLDEALRATSGEANVTTQEITGIPLNRTALTAEELRVAGSGVLLAAFQTAEADATKALLERTLPGLFVKSASFTWSNTVPEAALMHAGIPDAPNPQRPLDSVVRPNLREPPLILDAVVKLSYVTRVSIIDVVNHARANVSADPSKALKEEIKHREADGILDRNAFQTLGLGQLLDFQVPPGWRVTMQLRVPKGFTVEGATDELLMADDHRGVEYALDGTTRAEAASQAAVVTVSSRFTVTLAMLVAVLVVGYLIRLPLEIGALAVARGPEPEPPLDPRMASSRSRMRERRLLSRLLASYAPFWRRPR